MHDLGSIGEFLGGLGALLVALVAAAAFVRSSRDRKASDELKPGDEQPKVILPAGVDPTRKRRRP